MEPADHLSADRLYERRWASSLMEQVLRRLKEEYRAAGNAALAGVDFVDKNARLAAKFMRSILNRVQEHHAVAAIPSLR